MKARATGRTAAPPVGERDKLARKAAAKSGLISFAGGLPDPKLFPARALGAALQQALRGDTDAALQYGWPEGSAALRQYVARELRSRGAKVEADGVVITSGAQQAITLAVSSLSQRGRIGVEPESYPGALELFRAAHRPLCELGQSAAAYYVMPSVSNPRGQRMTNPEREGLLAQAVRRRAFIIEDDAYDGTWFSGERSTPLYAEAPTRVFQVGTFSKTLCPGLRIGWLVPPPALLRQVLRQKQARDLQANSLSQALLVRYLEGDQFERHQRRARLHYQRRAELLTSTVKELLPDLHFQAPRGGFSLWLEGGYRFNQKRLLAAAIQAGVSFDLGAAFRCKPRGTLAFRLCYSSVADEDIQEGVKRLARVLDAARSVGGRSAARR